MTSLPSADLGPFAPLAAYLQEITEALAATSTQREVIEIVIAPAVQALGAVAGIVLLVDQTDQQLKIAGSRGYEDGTLTLWQEGPIEDHQLISDILRMREARYFEHAGALREAYPELESRTGASAAIANAALPMFLDGRAFGIIVLDFKEPHHFTPAERRFLKILSAQCAVALGRAEAIEMLEGRVEERTRQLEEERAALEVFVAFTEAVGTQTDVLVLARQAIEVLRGRFPEASIGYYQREGELWKARVWTDDMPGDMVALIRAGLPTQTPMIAQMLRVAEAVFIDAWDPQREQLEVAVEYGKVGNVPLLVDGEAQAMLSIGLKNVQQWSEASKGLVRAVGRGLMLALERSETARRLEGQNAKLLARTRALEGFAELTRDLSLSSEPELLIRRAMELVLSLLPEGYALIWERHGQRWQIGLQVGEVGRGELQDVLQEGLLIGQTPSLDRPYQTQTPFFQDRYDRTQDIDPALVEHVGTVATLPVMVTGSVLGIFTVALFGQHAWSATDQAVLLTTVQSLGLALERAEQARQLIAQRDMLQASNEELEAFTYSVSHDLRTPVRHIVSFGGLLRRSLPVPLDEKTQHYLNIVEAAAVNLSQLIDGMLELSRTSRQPFKSEQVDLGRLLAAALNEVTAAAPARQITWQVAELPTVTGDVGLLRLVIAALLSNAVKYTRTRQEALIEVWAEDRGQTWAVLVRDNGVGFDPRYRDKLFTVFQRLHRQEDFEGAGVSLANARRIVARHGGLMTAEGQVGQGATFSFILPKVRT